MRRQFTDVRTHSPITATALLLLGHEPVRVFKNDLGSATFVFDLNAELDLHKFYRARHHMEALQAEALDVAR
jgi:hypothetical protein